MNICPWVQTFGRPYIILTADVYAKNNCYCGVPKTCIHNMLLMNIIPTLSVVLAYRPYIFVCPLRTSKVTLISQKMMASISGYVLNR